MKPTVCIACFALFLSGALLQVQAATTHGYDFGSLASPAEEGFKKVERNTIYSDRAKLAGFSQGLDGESDRGSEWGYGSESPAAWTRELPKGLLHDSVIHTANGFDFYFRDYAPVGAVKVDITIYLADPAAFFNPEFTTSVSIDGADPVVIDKGTLSTSRYERTDIGDPGAIYKPIRASINFGKPLDENSKLDIHFTDATESDSDPYNDYFICAGIQLTYHFSEPGK